MKPFKTTFLCPTCGAHLIIKEGQYGEFLGCPRFPQCRFSRSLPSEKDLQEWHSPPLFCKKCNHTGLLPYKMKSGKPARNAFLFCECNQPEEERYQPLKPDDFDFPMSSSFRAFSYDYCGIPDPFYVGDRSRYAKNGYLPSLCGDRPERFTAKCQDEPAQQNTRPAILPTEIQQIRAELTHLHNLVDRQFPKRDSPPPTKSDYKGGVKL